jgi:hypothetical protein
MICKKQKEKKQGEEKVFWSKRFCFGVSLHLPPWFGSGRQITTFSIGEDNKTRRWLNLSAGSRGIRHIEFKI